MQDSREDKPNYPSFIQFGNPDKNKSRYGVRTYGKVNYAGGDYYLSFSMMGTANDSTLCSLDELEFLKKKAKPLTFVQMKLFHGKILIDCEIMQTLKDVPDLQYTELSDDLANFINLPDQIEILPHVFTKQGENYETKKLKSTTNLNMLYERRTGKRPFGKFSGKCIVSASILKDKDNLMLTQDMINFPFISIDVDKFKKKSFPNEQNVSNQAPELNTILLDDFSFNSSIQGDNLEIYNEIYNDLANSTVQVKPLETSQGETYITTQDIISDFTFLNTPNDASTAGEAQGEAIAGCETANEQSVWIEQEKKPVEDSFNNSLQPNLESTDEYLSYFDPDYNPMTSFIYPDPYSGYTAQPILETPSQPHSNPENLNPIAEAGHNSKRSLPIDIDILEFTKRRRTSSQSSVHPARLFSQDESKNIEEKVSIVKGEIRNLNLDKVTLIKLKNSSVWEEIEIDENWYNLLKEHVNAMSRIINEVKKQTGIKGVIMSHGYVDTKYLLRVNSQSFLRFYCTIRNIDINTLEPISNSYTPQVTSNL